VVLSPHHLLLPSMRSLLYSHVPAEPEGATRHGISLRPHWWRCTFNYRRSLMAVATTVPEAKVRTPIAALARATPNRSVMIPSVRADRGAEVAPEAIGAERASPPRGCIWNGCDERRVDHGRPDAERHAGEQPQAETLRQSRREQDFGLDPYAGGDQAHAAPAVAQRTGHRREALIDAEQDVHRNHPAPSLWG
jgi:hypothetical protein